MYKIVLMLGSCKAVFTGGGDIFHKRYGCVGPFLYEGKMECQEDKGPARNYPDGCG